MTAHQQRLVALAKRQLEQITTPDSGIVLRHRDAGPHMKSVELLLTFEDAGHFFVTRTTVAWWSTSESVSHAVMKLLRELQRQHANTTEELRLS